MEEKLHSFSKAYEDEGGGKKKGKKLIITEERLHAVEKSGASIYKYLIQVCKRRSSKNRLVSTLLLLSLFLRVCT